MHGTDLYLSKDCQKIPLARKRRDKQILKMAPLVNKKPVLKKPAGAEKKKTGRRKRLPPLPP